MTNASVRADPEAALVVNPIANANYEDNRDSHEDKRPPLLVKLTGYRILWAILITAFGVSKAVLTYQGQSGAPTTLDWVMGVVVTIGLGWLGLYEGENLPTWRWFFHKDYSRQVLWILGIVVFVSVFALLILVAILVVIRGSPSGTTKGLGDARTPFNATSTRFHQVYQCIANRPSPGGLDDMGNPINVFTTGITYHLQQPIFNLSLPFGTSFLPENLVPELLIFGLLTVLVAIDCSNIVPAIAVIIAVGLLKNIN